MNIKNLVYSGITLLSLFAGYEIGKKVEKYETIKAEERCDFLRSRLDRIVVKFPAFEINREDNGNFTRTDISGIRPVKIEEYFR